MKTIDKFTMTAFIVTAVRRYAEEAAKADPAQITKDCKGWINGDAWVACAQAVLADEAAVLAAYRGKTQTRPKKKQSQHPLAGKIRVIDLSSTIEA